MKHDVVYVRYRIYRQLTSAETKQREKEGRPNSCATSRTVVEIARGLVCSDGSSVIYRKRIYSKNVTSTSLGRLNRLTYGGGPLVYGMPLLFSDHATVYLHRRKKQCT